LAASQNTLDIERQFAQQLAPQWNISEEEAKSMAGQQELHMLN
jgi:hypothetical protein